MAEQLIESRPCNEIIDRHGSAYIERWMVGRKITVPTWVASRSRAQERSDDSTPLPSEIENAYVHRYCRNDFEDMHCHPWGNCSIVLRGTFTESTPRGTFKRRPGEVVLRPANDRHAIVDVQPGTLSLFVTGPKERDWGFWPEIDGEPTFVHHREYSAWKRANGRE